MISRCTLVALFFLLPSSQAEARSESYTVGSWDIVTDTDSGFCQAKLSTWMYEIKIIFMENNFNISLSFGSLAFTSKDVWGYTGDVEFFKISNDAGYFALVPFSDFISYDTLELVARDGGLYPSRQDAWKFMGIVSSGDQIQISREVHSVSGREDDLLMSITQEGGGAAMQVIKNCN